MIGVYNYTVILTYMSLISSVLGMTLAHNGRYLEAVFLLGLCGVFDAFDGRVARTKLDRTDNERLFGIQLDSLVDAISFGAFPAFLCYCLGVNGPFGLIACSFFVFCGVARLAYFNVLESNTFFGADEEAGEKVYHGLPITASAALFPLAYLCSIVFTHQIFVMILTAFLLIVGFLYISPIKIKKPPIWFILLVTVIDLAIVGFLFVYTGAFSGSLFLFGN